VEERGLVMNSLKINPLEVFHHVPTLDQLQTHLADIEYCLFDLDGTMFNTEILHAQCLYKFLDDYAQLPKNIDVASLQKRYMGISEKMLFDMLIQENVLDQKLSYAEFLQLRNKSAVAKLETFNGELIAPAMLNLLSSLKQAGLLMSVVSSAEKIFIDAILTKFNLIPYFEFIMSREDTPRNKPDPMPYLEALKRSGRQVSQVIVFEDSQVGLTAASGAGLKVIHAKWY
jgi:HAD superfamily hydrolase (TIGR01509 family)